MTRRQEMRRSARLQSAKSWLQTYEGEAKKIVKAYRKRFSVDWPTAFHELEVLGVPIDAAYRQAVLESVERQAEAKRRKKAGSDDDFFLFEEEAYFERPFDLGIPIEVSARSQKADVPYDELDANIVSLVRALNSYPGVMTLGSCGGHEPPLKPSQWAAGTWYVKFDIAADQIGWYVLEFLAWAINEDARLIEEMNVILLPTAPPPYLNTPGECLHFVVEGHGGQDPEELANNLNEVRGRLVQQ